MSIILPVAGSIIFTDLNKYPVRRLLLLIISSVHLY